MTSILAALGVLAIAIFGVFARRAVDMWDKGQHQYVASSICLAVIPIALWMLWLTGGETSMWVRNLLLGSVGAVIGGAGLIWLGYVINPAIAQAPATEISKPKEDTMAPDAEKPINKNSPNISAGGNVTIGHIGDTTINQAPKPDLRFGGSKSVRNADGSFTVTIEFDVISPYPPASLLVEVWAPGIKSFEIVPQRTGGVFGGPSGVRMDHAFSTIMQPFGRNLLVVNLKELAKLDVRYDFDK